MVRTYERQLPKLNVEGSNPFGRSKSLPWLATLLVSACGGSERAVPLEDPAVQVQVVSIEAGDFVTVKYAERLLARHGIKSNTKGSIGWSLAVPQGQKNEAMRILVEEPDLRGYLTWVERGATCGGAPARPEAPATHIAIASPYREAIAAHSNETMVGRILRDRVIAALAEREAGLRVESVSWVRRPLMRENGERGSAVVATVHLSGRSDPRLARTEFAREVTLLDL